MHGDDTCEGDDGSSRRRILGTLGAAGASLLAGCLGGGSREDAGEPTTTATAARPAWQSVELRAVRSDETFTLAGLSAPVVVHSFAVWCPKCIGQSEQMAGLGDSVTAVGLNTDPNEDAATVREYANAHGFDWRFAVAPKAMTDALIEQFGTTVVNAPSTPVLVVCGGGSTTFLAGSVSDTEGIAAVAGEC